MLGWLKRIWRTAPPERHLEFPESAIAHRLLDGKKGIEIGASAHNPFGIPGTIYVDFTDSTETSFKKSELELVQRTQRVDVVALAWSLPFESESLDFVLSSHVIEHCFDIIGTVEEWFRVLRPGGLVFMVVPHMDRTFDKDEAPTPVSELVERHQGLREPTRPPTEHHSFFRTEDFLALCEDQRWSIVEHHDVDDKVGNGFIVVLRREG